MGRLPVNDKLLIALLAACCAVPAIGSGYRMVEIAMTGHWRLECLADQVDRLPLFIHAGGAMLFLALGAAQMVPGLRTRHMHWHRTAGRIAAIAGIIGALSGLWLTLAHPAISTPVLFYARMGASAVWLVSVILAIWYIRSKRIAQHRAWMMRAFAMALPAGTLVFILLPVVLVFGEEGNEIMLEAVQAAAWPLHLAIAEWLIRRKPKPQTAKRHLPNAIEV